MAKDTARTAPCLEEVQLSGSHVPLLTGSWDLVIRLIIRVTVPLCTSNPNYRVLITIHTKSHDPSSKGVRVQRTLQIGNYVSDSSYVASYLREYTIIR